MNKYFAPQIGDLSLSAVEIMNSALQDATQVGSPPIPPVPPSCLACGVTGGPGTGGSL